MTFHLRPYQIRFIEGIRTSLVRHRRVMAVLPTGGGKTSVTAHMMGGAARRGATALFLVHRRELLRQASDTFARVGIPHGIIAAGAKTISPHPIQVASIDTLIRRLDRIPAPKMIVFDEAHHAASTKWRAILDRWPDAYLVGLTATPWRLDGEPLTEFRSIVVGSTLKALVAEGYLVPPEVYAPPLDADLSGIATRFGDYQQAQLAERVDKPKLIGDMVDHYRRHADGSRAIAFGVSIAHSKHIADGFRRAGYRAAHIDGSIDTRERDRLVAAFATGEVQILCNCDLISEGFDVPAAETAILARPTKSLTLFLQQCGRVLRPAPGKSRGLILDHAGNALRHGMPDEDRAWSLEGRKKGVGVAREMAPQVQRCPACFAAHVPAPRCPACGHVYEAAPREVTEGAGELQRVDPAELKAQKAKQRAVALREEHAARSLKDLIEIGKRRGYRYPWAWANHRWKHLAGGRGRAEG